MADDTTGPGLALIRELRQQGVAEDEIGCDSRIALSAVARSLADSDPHLCRRLARAFGACAEKHPQYREYAIAAAYLRQALEA